MNEIDGIQGHQPPRNEKEDQFFWDNCKINPCGRPKL